MIEKAKFPNFLLKKAFKKQTKTIENQVRKQIDAIMNRKKDI